MAQLDPEKHAALTAAVEMMKIYGKVGSDQMALILKQFYRTIRKLQKEN